MKIESLIDRCKGLKRLTIGALMGLAFANAAWADLPDAFVEYVESDGTQYIDTGVIGRCGTVADMTITWLGSGDTSFLSSRVDSGDTRFVLCNYGGKYYACHRKWTGWGNVTASTDKDRVVSSITNDDSYVYVLMTVNGNVSYENKQDINTYPAYNTGLTMYLFAQHKGNASNGVDLNSKVRCYGVKIWQDDVLVRDFLPCVKNGRVGLYDDVTKSMFYPQGGELAAGAVTQAADIPDWIAEYVESDGTQYIDTGVIGKCNTTAEMTITWLGSGDKSFLSSRADGGNTRFILCSNNNSGNGYYAGHGIYWWCSPKTKASTMDCIVSSIASDGTDVTTTMTINDVQLIQNTQSNTAALDTQLNMYLFAQNNAGKPDLLSSVRCYGVRIWQDGELVRDFLPCVKNGSAGLFDDVSKTIFYPQGGGLKVDKFYGKPDHIVQYVESTGTQHVDTGIIGRCNTKADMTIQWLDANKDGAFLGSRTDYGETRFTLCANDVNNLYYACHGIFSYADDGSISKVKYDANKPDRVVCEIAHDGTQMSMALKVNNNVIGMKDNVNGEFTSRTEDALDTGLNMYLFAQNIGGTPAYNSSVRFFGTKIWQDDVLVRDFRPCVKDGRAGLYDEVSGCIFFPQGGELVYPDETPDKFVKWVSITGKKSFVPTGVRAKNGVRSEMKFRPADKTTGDQYLLAARRESTTDTRFLLNYLYHRDSGDYMCIGYNNQ